jgi:hypothetical protein
MAKITYIRGLNVVAEFELAEGLTLNQAKKTLCPDTGEFPTKTIAIVGADICFRKDWDEPLQAEVCVTFIDKVAGGGGGGGGGKNVLQILGAVVLLAVAVLSWGTSAGLWAGLSAWQQVGLTVLGMGLSLIGSMMNQQKPNIPGMNMGALNAAQASPTYNINSTGNQARLWQVEPEGFGRMRVVPDFVAQTYVEYSNNQQYGYFVYGIGRGEYKVESLQFGETVFWRDGEILTSSGYYQDGDSLAVELVQPGNPVTLFPDNVFTNQEISGQTLFAPNDAEYSGAIGPHTTNPPGTKTNRVLIDYVFPQGLCRYNDQGNMQTYSVSIRFRYRPVDDFGNPIGQWQTAFTKTHTDATLTSLRFTQPVDLPEGRYDWDGVRTSNTPGDSRTRDTVVWQGMRALLPGEITYKQSVIAVKVRASNALSQAASTKFSCITTRKLPIYDTATKTWSALTPTRSWAAAICAILKEEWGGNLQDYHLDLDTIWNIDEQLAAQGWHFDAFIDGPYTIWQLIIEACQAVAVIPRLLGGVISFVRDIPDRPARYVFHPRNIVRNTFNLKWHTWSEESPDDVIIEYLDADHGYANWDVRAVLPESESLKPAQLKMIGITDREHAFRLAVMYAARNRWRRIEVELQTEHMGRLINRGDVCQVVHPRFTDTAGGKVQSWNEQNLTLRLKPDFEIESVPENAYISFTSPDGSPWGPCRIATIVKFDDTYQVALDSADFASIVLQGKGSPFEGFRNGNDGGIPTVWTLQESREFNRRMIVTKVIPQDPHHYTVTLVNDAKEIANYDDLPVPPWMGRTQTNVVDSLDAPTMLRGKGQNDGATLALSWNVVPGAWWYDVEYSHDGEGWASWGRVSVSSFSHAVAPGLIYARVRAATDTIMSPWSLWQGDTLLVPPDAPVVTATDYLGGEATITWPLVTYPYGPDGVPETDDDAESPVTEYMVSLSTGYDVTPFYTENITATDLDADLVFAVTPEMQEGGPYRTIIASVYAANAAGQSDAGRVTLTDSAPPTVVAAVTEIASNSITLTSVLLEGQTVDEENGDITPEYPDTTGYVIVRGNSYNFALSQITDTQYVDSLPFTYTGLKHNSQVYFRIAAKDAFFDAFHSLAGLNFSTPQTLTTSSESPYVDPPVITSPEPESRDVGLRIPVEFTVDRDGDTLEQAQLQASTAKNFASVAYDSGLVNYASTLTTGVLAKLTAYYVRVRVKGISISKSGVWPSTNLGDTSISGGHGTGFVPSFEVASTPYTTLDDVSIPTQNDTAYVLKDELHGGSMYMWKYADYNGDGVSNWVPIAPFIQRIVTLNNPGIVPASTTGMILGTDIYGNVVWRQWSLWDVGLLKPWESTVLPPNCCWPNGDFISFSDWPEMKWKYDNGFFAGKLLAYNASQSTIAANLGCWRPDAANPTGLYTPNVGDQFFRNWVAGLTSSAGSWHRGEIPNITGDITMSVTFVGGTLPNDVFYLTNINYQNVGGNTSQTRQRAYMDLSRQVPTGPVNVPPYIMEPLIIYLGMSA